MRLLITGTRNGRDNVHDELDRWVSEYGLPSLIVLGDARGVDAQALEWAKRNWCEYRVFCAPWSNLGKRAGPARNQSMVNECTVGDHCLAFPDAKSKGTWDCIGRARRAGMIVRIV